MSDEVHTTSKQRFEDSYVGALNEIAKRYSPSAGTGRLHANILPYIKQHPVRATAMAGVSALAIGASVFAWGPAMTVAQGVGIAAFVLARESATFKHHTQVLAVASVSCLLSTAQQAIMGATSGDIKDYLPPAIMLAHAAGTTGAFAIMPQPIANPQTNEDKQKDKEIRFLRGAFAWSTGLVGAAAAAYASYKYQNGIGIIPAITTLGNSLLFSIKDANTPLARLGYIGMNLGHAFLWATQPVQSAALLLTEAMYLTTHSVTLAEHDVPVADRKTGRSFTTRERMSAYWNNIIGKGEKATDIGVTRHEQGWERPDNKVYGRIGRLILGS